MGKYGKSGLEMALEVGKSSLPRDFNHLFLWAMASIATGTNAGNWDIPQLGYGGR